MTSPLLAEALARIEARRPLALHGLQAGGKAWLLSALAGRLAAPLVVVCDSLRRAEELAEDLAFHAGPRPVHLFPHWDTVPYDGFSPQKEVMAQRLQALSALLEGATPLLVTTPQAWQQGTMPLAELRRLRFGLRQGGRYPRAELLAGLAAAGYVRVDLVEAPGEFSARGEIVDVFPIHLEHPLRLDFFDDELESLRRFEVGSQTSFEDVEAVTIYPASEGVVTPETAAGALKRLPHYKSQVQPDTYRQLWHYLEQGAPFPGSEQMLGLFYERASWLDEALPPETVVVLDEPPQLEQTAEHFWGEVLGEHELCLRQGSLALPPEAFYRTTAEWQQALARFYRIPVHALRLEGTREALVAPFADNSSLRAAPSSGGKTAHAWLGDVVSALKAWRNGGAPVFVAARSETGAERLRQVLSEFDVGVRLLAPAEAELETLLGGSAVRTPAELPDIAVLTATPNRGFRVVDPQGNTRFALVTEEEMLGEKQRQRRLKKSKLQHFIASLGELKEGDRVVHVEYGIGRYDGLQRLHAAGEEGDFLVLAYAGGDKVYVPVYKFHQVQKYTGVDDAAPPLNRLGDGSWQRSKARASKAVEDMAEELVAIYAARRARKGHAFDPNRAMMTEFEEAFPFQETEDQQVAIEEVLANLAAETPMDRLVCGDVGFGKTEVAMRAAYMAVLGGKQVLVLVPTTILAQQHYETFTKRFEPFPVRVDVLSRFRSPADQKQVAKAFAAGEIDILIGTHRLFSKDIAPKALGLLVIDEEQRFGVAHKEKIKKLRTQVDVLTLSATPIPRTLHMSLMGVRDLSIINTAPMDRIAVRTRLVKSSDYIITEAIEREVRRGGQVFFVHNRVEHIHQFGTYVQSLVPHLRVAIAHGQMPEKQLEEVMLGFVHGDVEVLVSTSIIESGLDIPRANTILISNADHFGLSQLYQLRGRVGRSNVQAYAYLLVSPEKVLTDVAQKRLTLLQELNDLGSGFKIASHDLEIRGAGNLLGREQSGHITQVGLELFTHMVEEAVARLKGEEAVLPVEADCKLELGFPYLLPEDYIASTQQRLDVYKTLAEIRSEPELWEVRQTLEDRFGHIPEPLANLFELIRVRLLALRIGLSALERSGSDLVARFGHPERIDVERLMALVNNGTDGFRLLPDERLVLGAMPPSPQGVLERLKTLEPVIVHDKAA
ncbi:MAG TPA: transcription-repair coupling factor [bacterium]|nr:transcription-repair coupling factor [bacterium]